VARFVHQASPRKDGPFIAINCAALPEQLLESELFGTNGAPSPARSSRRRTDRAGRQGVLFLDEVSEMSLAAAGKFLRFLQEREFQRLGGTRIQKANVRVIAASNRDLRQASSRASFVRISSIVCRCSTFSCRAARRLSDVPLLADHFLAEFGQRSGTGQRVWPTRRGTR